MNTANLQLEGLLLALSSLLELMTRKGLLTQEEIDEALGKAEMNAGTDSQRPSEISAANIDAICFPARFLRAANKAAGSTQTFTAIAASVGKTKPDR